MSSEPPPDTSSELPPATDSVPPSAGSSEGAAAVSSPPSPDAISELPPAIYSAPPSSRSSEALLAVNSPPPPAITTESPSPRRRRFSWPLVIRLTVEGVLGAYLIGLLVFSSVDRWQQANAQLAGEVATQSGQLADQQSQIQTLQAEVQDLKERWYGSPALFSPPAISNTDIQFFELTGTTQQQLINSLDKSSICTTYGPCAPDPAVPNGVAWGLEGSKPAISSYLCYSPRNTTIPYREFIVLPRWSPPTDGSVKIPLVEAWNALAQVIYTHEAGHVAIDQQDIAALNDQAHGLPNCAALISFWSSPSLFDKDNADQAAYHTRLHADCRPEIGCIPPNWMGWS